LSLSFAFQRFWFKSYSQKNIKLINLPKIDDFILTFSGRCDDRCFFSVIDQHAKTLKVISVMMFENMGYKAVLWQVVMQL